MEINNDEQRKLCLKYGVKEYPSPSHLKVGVSLNIRDKKIYPINGLRHAPEGDTTGWYIWGGDEFSDEDNFFVPLHVNHLNEWRPEIMKYLSLPPGYRFLIGENEYEDVWFDSSLLGQ